MSRVSNLQIELEMCDITPNYDRYPSADDYIELYVYWSDSGASGNKNATANCRLAGCKIG